MTERLPASVWPVNSLAGRCWWWFWEMAALRRSCLGMQEERDRESKSKRQERRWWWWWENEKLKCALPLGDLYKWPQIERMLFGIHTDFSTEQCMFYSSFPLSWWGCTPRKGGTGRGGLECGAVEEWLPSMELRDESRTGILFCQLECANGDVRAGAKLMNLIGEMPPLSPNAWSIAIVFSVRCTFVAYYFLIVFSAGPGCFAAKILMVNFESRK